MRKVLQESLDEEKMIEKLTDGIVASKELSGKEIKTEQIQQTRFLNRPKGVSVSG